MADDPRAAKRGDDGLLDPDAIAEAAAAGVPLVEAMESVAGATGNIVFEQAVLKMRDEVATGQRLQQAMENTDLFPNMVVQMIAVGEESGSLDEMSAKVADFYEREVDDTVNALTSLIEPLLIITMGISVGGISNNRRLFGQGIEADHLPDTLLPDNAFSRGMPANGWQLAERLNLGGRKLNSPAAKHAQTHLGAADQL